MRFPQVENVPGLGLVQRWVCTSTRTWPLLAPVPMKALAGPGSVHVELTSLEPTLCGCAGGAGSVTQPLEVAVAQPAAPAIVQLQILTVCWGQLLGMAVHVVATVLPQFSPLYVTLRFCAPAGSP